MQTSGTIVEINPTRGLFIGALEDGSYAAFTLYDHAMLEVGDRLSRYLPDAARGAAKLFCTSAPTVMPSWLPTSVEFR